MSALLLIAGLILWLGPFVVLVREPRRQGLRFHGMVAILIVGALMIMAASVLFVQSA
jgi:uncharacterized membrane protein